MGKKTKAKRAAAAQRRVSAAIRRRSTVAGQQAASSLFGGRALSPPAAVGFGQGVYVAKTSECPAAETLLTRQELAWACQARDAASELNVKCTTVELVQIATVSKGNPEKARSRLLKLQTLKDDYALPMSFKTAHSTVNEPIGGHHLVPCGRLQPSGSVGFAAFYSHFYPGRLPQEMVPMVLGSICAMFEALSCSLFDIRNGVFVVVNARDVGYQNISLSMEAKFARLYNSGYPVRVAQLVVVDASFMARAAIKGVKALLSKKLSERLISIRSNELSEYFNVKELPPFLGDGSNHEDSVSYHTRHAGKRRQLEAALSRSYGYKFESTPSDSALWVEVSDTPSVSRPAAACEESDDEDAIPVQCYVPRPKTTLL